MVLVDLISKRDICEVTRRRGSKKTMDQDDYVESKSDIVGIFGFVKVIHSHNGVDGQEKVNHGENHERPNNDFEEHG